MELVVILVSIGITSVVCFALGWLFRVKGRYVYVPIALGFTVFSVFLSGAIGELARYFGLMHQGGDGWALMQWFYLGLIVFPLAHAFGSNAGATRTAPVYAMVDPSLITLAIGRAISKFRENQGTQEICPTCMSRIQVTTNGTHPTSGPQRLSTSCDCGACAGSFHVPQQ